jgi:UDP-galactopyranose mutase
MSSPIKHANNTINHQRNRSSSLLPRISPLFTLAAIISTVWLYVLIRFSSTFPAPVTTTTNNLRNNMDTSSKYTSSTINNKKLDDIFAKQYDNCIIGSGLSGSVIAQQYSTFNQSSLIIEKRSHIGGNCYDTIDSETGIRISLYGAHLFHTNSDRVWNYVQQFGHWVNYEHKVLGLVNGKYVPIPVNIDTVNALFDLNISTEEEMKEWLIQEQVLFLEKDGTTIREPKDSEEVALTRVGERLYELIFKPYTWKQWAKYPKELGPEVLSRIPVRSNHDGRYFSDRYQALPQNGYTSLFENMLDSPWITVVTDTDYFDVRDKIQCKRLYCTGPIDAYFNHLGWPKLEYRSLSFERGVKFNTEYFQPAAVVNHPQSHDYETGKEVDFTRIVEYKHFLNQTSDHTVYFIERSTDDGDPYYPVPNDENKELYKRYQEMAEKEEGVRFVGRLANYKYFNMDQAILNALEVVDQDTGRVVVEEG